MAGQASNSISINTTRRGPAHVVQIGGEVDLQSAPKLRAALDEVLKQTPAQLVIDLAGATYIDSSGVGTIVYLKREVERVGGKLVLSGLQPRVRSIFEITQLDRFFQIAGTLEEALRA